MYSVENVQFCDISESPPFLAAKHRLLGRHRIKTVNTSRKNFILFKIFGLGEIAFRPTPTNFCRTVWM
ncbi:MAG TPA: hypothetical protein VGK06_10740 [Methanosarcina sp.]